MSKITNKQAAKIANLARIEIAEAEQQHYADKLSTIINWVESLNEIDTENTLPMAALEADLPLRADEPQGDNIVDEVLSNAPEKQLGFFAVPKFVE